MSNDFSYAFLHHEGKLTDKWSSYLPIYDRIFEDYRAFPISLLEIGIQNGGSLEIWSKYFHNAESIIGCDVDEKCGDLIFEDERISVLVGDANSEGTIKAISNITKEFDIIIDDGSHRSQDIVASFINYFPKVRSDGIYVVEDIHASYWRHYTGGLKRPDSSIEFFKSLVDIVNYEHWGLPKSRTEYLASFNHSQFDSHFEPILAQIHEISFMNSICVVRKKSSDKNTLGVRRIIGNEDPVTDSAKHLDGRESVPDLQVEKPPLRQRVRSLVSNSLKRH